jgi:hypothetical protein
VEQLYNKVTKSAQKAAAHSGSGSKAKSAKKPVEDLDNEELYAQDSLLPTDGAVQEDAGELV